MKNKLIILSAVIFLSLFFACQKDEVRIDNYLVELATVRKTEANSTFLLDNGTVLTPKNAIKTELENGNRVILNYSPMENEFININNVRRIFLDTIREKGYPNEVKTDPIRIISMWVSGKYLNMSLEVDYHSKSHKTGMFINKDALEPTLYFSYSREDDPAGAPTLTYLSFNIESLQKKNFIIYVNTTTGMRGFDFKLDL